MLTSIIPFLIYLTTILNTSYLSSSWANSFILSLSRRVGTSLIFPVCNNIICASSPNIVWGMIWNDNIGNPCHLLWQFQGWYKFYNTDDFNVYVTIIMLSFYCYKQGKESHKLCMWSNNLNLVFASLNSNLAYSGHSVIYLKLYIVIITCYIIC